MLGFEPNQGPSLRPALLVGMAVFAAAVLVVGMVVPDMTTNDMGRLLFTSSVGAFIAGQMFLTPQIRHHGILVNSQLVRWNKITSYTWQRNKPHELTLLLLTSLPFRATRRVAMPPIYRDKVELLLAEHVASGVQELG